jgi:hypothetical protein
MSRFTGALLLAVVALGPVTGCRPDFPPFNRVTSLRVLAIQSDPPTPATGETATLSALVFNPTDDPTLTYSWSWCPFPGPSGQGHQCLITEAEANALAVQLGQGTPLPSFDLGTDPTAMLSNAIDSGILATLCAGIPGAPQKPNCADGFPIQVSLTVKTEGTGAEHQVDAVVTMHWWFLTDTSSNANPSIDKLTATIGGVTSELTEPATIDTITLPRDVKTPIDASVTLATAAQVYDGLDDDMNPATGLRERLFLTWFVETGGTEDTRTSFIDGITPPEDLGKNGWYPALSKDYAKSDARIFVVIHDNRGGVNWRSGVVHLESTP